MSVSSLLPLLLLVVAGVFLFVFGWLWFRISSVARQIERKVEAEGVDGEGVVTAHRISRGRRGVRFYHLTVEYTVRQADGKTQTLTTEDIVSYADYDKFLVGERVPVRYLPDMPSVVKLDGIRKTFNPSTTRLSAILTMIVAVLPIVLAVGLYYDKVHNFAPPGTAPQGRLVVPMLTDLGGQSKNQIFRFDLDGAGRVNITNTQTDEQWPVWSPDGKQIVFVSQRDGFLKSQIYVMNADGSNPINVSNNLNRYDMDPLWSPDGKQIVFRVDYRDSVAKKNGREIWVMDADGKNQQNLSSQHAHNDTMGSWSPDSKQIVFTGTTEAGSAIWIMDRYGTHQVAITDANGEDFNPVWSPDGKQIAFARRGGDSSSIWLVNIDGSNPHQLTTFTNLSPHLAWSPDGQMIGFISSAGGYNQVTVIKADGSDLHVVSTPNVADSSFIWSPNNGQILTEANLTSGKMGVLTLLDLATGTRKIIVDDTYSSSAPSWMPS